MVQSVICESFKGLNVFRCEAPIANADGSVFDCRTDCVCIHGFEDGTCSPIILNTIQQCLCNNNGKLNGKKFKLNYYFKSLQNPYEKYARSTFQFLILFNFGTLKPYKNFILI